MAWLVSTMLESCVKTWRGLSTFIRTFLVLKLMRLGQMTNSPIGGLGYGWVLR
ncbi:hypothetical protein RchiOBHm_Chr7g0232511 [Rosa chinensis]|uniref:Uncharacterized protein n=1 Tax=Rosa chinensis TaxID=74649 RepID=A0A2P6PFZ3_ROSCH|nr:hypothetical protein RchiOBHm_Chr7g0232511 [Rosa chinensis]